MEKEKLKELAAMARIAMSEDDLDSMLPAFEHRLGQYASILGAAKLFPRLSGISPACLNLPASATLRSDNNNNFNNNPVNNSNNNLVYELMNRAPEFENGFFTLPNVL